MTDGERWSEALVDVCYEHQIFELFGSAATTLHNALEHSFIQGFLTREYGPPPPHASQTITFCVVAFLYYAIVWPDDNPLCNKMRDILWTELAPDATHVNKCYPKLMDAWEETPPDQRPLSYTPEPVHMPHPLMLPDASGWEKVMEAELQVVKMMRHAEL